MADIMKALPFLSAEEYMWGFSSSFIRLMCYDQSRIRYLSNKEIEEKKRQKEKELNSAFTAEDVLKHLGMFGSDSASSVSGNWIEQLTKKDKQ